MLIKKPFYKKPKFWQWAVPGGLFFLWLLAFRSELGLTWRWFWLGMTLPEDAALALEMRRAVFITLLNTLAFMFFFFGSLISISQFVLPVQTLTERRKAIWRFFLYFIGMHGPAITVREGAEIANPEELKKPWPGVALVDPTSAIVLERQPFLRLPGAVISMLFFPLLLLCFLAFLVVMLNPLFVTRPLLQLASIALIPISIILVVMLGLLIIWPRIDAWFDRLPWARAAGPGIVFTSYWEKVRGVVSLRRQFKLQPPVPYVTRDGIEIKAPIIAIYSLSDPPPVLTIGYAGETAGNLRAEDIRVVQFDAKRGVITGFSDEVDLEDQREAHAFVQRFQSGAPSGGASSPPPERQFYFPPYTFDPERVFRAVYGEMRKASDASVESWLNLPAKVAVATFRDMIQRENYRDLYMPENPKTFPFWERFRPAFIRRVRNQGMLSYKFVRRRDGLPLAKDQDWNPSELEFLPVQPFRSSKALRDRGITIFAASVPELKPVNPLTAKQLFDYWSAYRSKEESMARAPYDYQVAMLRAKARAQAQQDIAESFKKILESQDVSQELIIWRLLQSIDALSGKIEKEKLLPNTIHMLATVHQWFDDRHFPRLGFRGGWEL